jgi:hypothetical protein
MPEWLGGSFLKPYGIDRKDVWRFYEGMFLRWYKRIGLIAQKANTSEINQDDWDFIFAYFICCYHLRDWLIVSYPSLQNDIDQFIHKSVELQICHDICNGLKHSSLDRPKRDADFNIYREFDHCAQECGENPIKYRVASGDGHEFRKYALFDLAEKCMEAWRSFLENHSLIRNPSKEKEPQ